MKRKNPETGKVDPDYYFGDVKTQRRYIINFFHALNAQKKPGEPQTSPDAAVRSCMKRVARHYGLTSKYHGDGSLRQ